MFDMSGMLRFSLWYPVEKKVEDSRRRGLETEWCGTGQPRPGGGVMVVALLQDI